MQIKKYVLIRVVDMIELCGTKFSIYNETLKKRIEGRELHYSYDGYYNHHKSYTKVDLKILILDKQSNAEEKTYNLIVVVNNKYEEVELKNETLRLYINGYYVVIELFNNNLNIELGMEEKK